MADSCAPSPPGGFESPKGVTVSHGRAFVVDNDDDDDDEGTANTIYVIDMQSGDFLQSVRLELHDRISAILVDGDEIYIAGFDAQNISVLQLAGSET